MKKGYLGLAVAVAVAVGAMTHGVLYASETYGKKAHRGKGEQGKCMAAERHGQEMGGKCAFMGKKGMMRGQKGMAKGKRDLAARKLGTLLHNRKELGLTDEQAGKIAGIGRTLAKDRIALKAQIKALEIDIRALARKDAVAVDAIRPLIEQKYEAKKELSLKNIAALAQAQGVLTPEQLEKAKELGRDKRHACGQKGKAGHHHHRRAPGHGGRGQAA